jgi:hypothetical protein
MGHRLAHRLSYAAVNLMIRASELTKIHVSWDAHHNRPWVVRLTDTALFQYPMIVASDVGTMASRRRQRGCAISPQRRILWVDDFGARGVGTMVSQIGKALDSTTPDRRSASSHPIFRIFPVSRMPQVTNIQFWRASGGTETSGVARSIDVHTARSATRTADHGADDAQYRSRRLWSAKEDPHTYQFSPPVRRRHQRLCMLTRDP